MQDEKVPRTLLHECSESHSLIEAQCKRDTCTGKTGFDPNESVL